ncbi:methionyl-tRNA formyltransferase [Chloroflexota bacterium]
MRVIFMGTPYFSVPVLARLVEEGYEVVAVYTQPDKPSGRGRSVTPSPIKETALKYSLHVEEPTSFKDEAVVDYMQSFEPDITVVASYGHILPKRVIDMPSHSCLNIHPSLLPKYRGPSPVAGAILAGDSETGVTVMTVLPKVDSGHILAQLKITIDPGDTTGSLTPKLFHMGANLLAYTIPRWVDGEIVPHPQDESQVTYTRTYTKDDGLINWNIPAVQIARMIQAFNPWPGCYTTWQGKTLKLLEAIPLPESQTEKIPGQVIKPGETEADVGVITGNGILLLRTIQLVCSSSISTLPPLPLFRPMRRAGMTRLSLNTSTSPLLR